MKTLFIILTALLIAGCNPNTHEDAINEAPILQANSLAGKIVWDSNNCASCHGEDGSISALALSRVISQITEVRDIENALIALSYPNSNRNPIMKDIAVTLTDQEVLDLSEFIFTLK